MARLRDTYHYQGIHFSNLYEMFHDYPAYVQKQHHKEFSLAQVATSSDLYSSGKAWVMERGRLKTKDVGNWCYLEEMERRLVMLEDHAIPRPAIGKHITWWADFTETLAGSHASYVDRVHAAVAGITDRAIVLWRRDLANLAASLEVLSFGFEASGRSQIRTHGRVVVGDSINRLKQNQANRFVERFVAGLSYLDKQKTVMIEMSELDQVETLTWPDGYSVTLDNRSLDQFKNTYFKQDVEQIPVSGALDLVTNRAEIDEWAQQTQELYNWTNLREQHGFVRGF